MIFDRKKRKNRKSAYATPVCNPPGYTISAEQRIPTPQTGHRVTFGCPLHAQERTRLLGDKDSWEALDTPNEIKVDVNTYGGGVPLFFSYLFDQFT